MKEKTGIKPFNLIIVFSLIFVITLSLLMGEGTPVPQLADRYKQWLNEVTYIITRTEKEVFFKLQTDRERDIFIKAFWDHRDPTAGTPENEFKDEHYKRLAYVEKVYGRAKFNKPGWKTDRGKVYIILGEPQAIQRFDTYTTVYPLEVWHYQIEPKGGLPPTFNIIFYAKEISGEMVLYSPISDGPQKLLIGYQGKAGETYEAYEQLHEYNSFLADTAISLIPGEENQPGVPSMSSDFLLRNIEEAPKKEVEDIYARKFLQYKGIVEVDYSINYVMSQSLSQIIKNQGGDHIFNYIIQLKKLTVDLYDDVYFSNIEVYGNLSDLAGNSIYQFQKIYNVRLNEDQFRTIQSSSFAITDQFPIIPGKYKLSIMIKNTSSKEFSAYETDVNIPQPSEKIFVSEPVLAYNLKAIPASQAAPFSTPQGQLIVDPESKFCRQDEMSVFFQVEGNLGELRKSGSFRLEFKGENNFSRNIEKKFSEYPSDQTDFFIKVPLNDFPADYYTVDVNLMDKNNTRITGKMKRFFIAPTSPISRPQTFSKTSSINSEAINSYILGTQYINIKNTTLALSKIEKAHYLAPQVKDFALALARLYFDMERFDKIETMLLPFYEKEKPDFQLVFLMGSACQRLGKFEAAAEYYRRLIIYHGMNTDVLNALASCYFSLGNYEEARKAWEQSLKVDPKQEKVKQALKGVTK